MSSRDSEAGAARDRCQASEPPHKPLKTIIAALLGLNVSTDYIELAPGRRVPYPLGMLCQIGGLTALLLLLSACPGPAAPPNKPVLVDDDTLPAIPVAVDATIVPPNEEHDPSARSKLLDIMAAENARWMKQAPTSGKPAYFLGYTIHDRRVLVLEAESGALTADADESHRALDVEIRVGTPALDNRHPIQDPQLAQLTSFQHLGIVPRGEDKKAISHHLWLETDRRYREASELLRLIETQKQVRTGKDLPPDFVHGEAQTYIQPIKSIELNRAEWEPRIRACSKRAKTGVATRGSCRVDVELNTVYYVNSEGSAIQKSWTTSRFAISVGVKADDGMSLSRLEQDFAPTPAQLSTLEREAEMIKLVTTDLNGLHKAPVVDPWAGPAILEGRAAAVFFHEVFGHRIEGHRQKNPHFGKTFTNAVGKSIMPSWLSVYDDPTIRVLNNIFVNGFFHYDDEGRPAQRVPLVDEGVLKGFVMGRSPIDGFASSNGHGRAEIGLNPVSRQGNLVVESSRSVDREEIYKRLIKEVKKQGKEFGMVFTDISGGFTKTSTFDAQSFKVQPIMAYRVYADGRKELVRGVDISGLPLTAFDNIMAAARPLETFNGMCGAESGWVPVSASAPSLLIRTLEVERGFEPSGRDPVLPPPSISGGSR